MAKKPRMAIKNATILKSMERSERRKMSDCMKCDFGAGDCTCGREAAISQVPAPWDCSDPPRRWGLRQASSPFPSDSGKMTIEVFYQKGDPAFVCGAHGSITGRMIENIEKGFAANPDEGFERGDGIYLYAPRWESPQVGDEGRIELPGYWDLEEVGFKPNVINLPRNEAE